MDAYLSPIAPFDPPPVLIASTSDAATNRAAATIEYQGLRIGARLSVRDALDRIRMQPSATAIWIEIDRDVEEELTELLAQVRKDTTKSRYGAILSLTGCSETLPRLIDPVSHLFDDEMIELIANADAVDRIAALATVTAKLHASSAIADAANDRSAERLRQLSEEVSRIASTLARLSTGPVAVLRERASVNGGEIAAPRAEAVAAILRARRLRARFFPEEIFADPAWDMLLDLFQAEIRQLRVPVSSLCIAAAVPATTALRWLKTLVGQGLFVRRPDPHDGRRVYVELAPDTSQALRRYFAEVGSITVI